MTRPDDWRERKKALDTTRSYIVQAPAGSGKTELLVQRMLGLLARVEHPEQVLAITFTRKAAAEMANRVFGELYAAGDQDAVQPDEAHKQLSRELALRALANDDRHGWQLLLQPSRLRIRTIDSLCSDLARQLPVSSGLGQGFAITTRPETTYLEAANLSLSAVEDEGDPLSTDIVRVLNRYDNQYDRLADLLVSMLANRDQWLPHLLSLRTDRGFDRASLEESLEVLLAVNLEALKALMPIELIAGVAPYFEFALQHDPGDSEALALLLNTCLDGAGLKISSRASALPLWKTLASRLITKDGKHWRKSVTKNDGFPAPSSVSGQQSGLYRDMKSGFLALLEKQRDNDVLREALHSVMSLPEPHYTTEDWADLESLLRILLRTVEEWQLVSARSGQVDFIEVASRARLALGADDSPSNVALRLDYSIAHILVDEFQDTSSGQVALLERLTEGWADGDGRSLFLVGDPKQSIYRFRKAEVSLFIRAWQGDLFQHINAQRLRLSVNFRSRQPVVEWVNRVFPQVMPLENDPVMGAVRYSPAATRPDVSANGSVSLHVGLDEPEYSEAEQMIRLIDQAGEDESIAVLVRSRNHARAILTFLDSIKTQQHRYRYRATEFFRLNESPTVLDLVSLTLAIVQPADRLAWLALLRAPFCGLSLQELDLLTMGQRDELIVLQLSALAEGTGNPAGLPPDAVIRAARISPVLSAAMLQYQRRPLRDIVEDTWLRLGGPACLRHPDEMRDAQTYFDLLCSMENERIDIDRETLEARLEQLYAAPDSSAGTRIHVMTIFAAKGLEFDRVILPGLNKRTSGDSSQLIQWFELAGTDHLVVSPMRSEKEKQRAHGEGDLISFISLVERKRQHYELGRLLYVAATRARSHLHLLGTLQSRADGSLIPSAGSMLGLLWPAVAQEVLPQLTATPDNPDTGTSTTMERKIPQIHRRFDANWKLPEPPPSIHTSTPDLPDPADYIEFSWAGEDARLGGSLVHRILQWMTQSGNNTSDFAAVNAGLDTWCRGILSGRGIHGVKADSVVSDVFFAVEKCLSSETGQWILSDHQQSHSEMAITAVIEGRVRNLVIDRTFVDQDTRWIIDFKTSRHAGGDLDGFLQQESERYAEQMRAYRKAMSGMNDLPVKTALYYPVFDRLINIE